MSCSNSTKPTLITSQIFCDPAADVVFKSCDNVLFHIDRKNLEVTTGGFPPPGFRSEGEYTELTESAATLELLFSFVYPSRHPPLMEVDFEVFADFAEAAEKYEVFCAIHTANTKMREAIQDHPIEVMNYASRHGYSELLDAAAPLTLDIPFDQIADTMNINILPAWLRYYHKWNQVTEVPKFTGHWRSLTEFCPFYQDAIQRLAVNDWVRAKVAKMTTGSMGQLSQCSQWCNINAMRYQLELQNLISTIPSFTELDS